MWDRHSSTQSNCNRIWSWILALDGKSWLQVSISPTFYKQLFCSKMFCAAFLCLQFGFVIFGQKELAQKLCINCWWNRLQVGWWVASSMRSNSGQWNPFHYCSTLCRKHWQKVIFKLIDVCHFSFLSHVLPILDWNFLSKV